jgi:ubiquinol-cytochrome c reductase cytochrome c1 subunit
MSSASLLRGLSAGAATLGGAALYAYVSGGSRPAALASDDGVHPPHLPWNHRAFYQQFDARSIRRGYHVYRNVCATCHSMNRLAFRNLVGVAYTEKEMKEMAADIDIEDGPNDEGEMYTRPGKLADYFPAPYPNEQASRAANNGALPPDLTVIAKARHGGEDYIFHLLTGYAEAAPTGVELPENQYYNPYFPGGKIGMAPPLFDGVVDFDDGTEANTSQVAKDVATFLAWSASPDQDLRHKIGTKVITVLGVWLGFTTWYKRFRWSAVKTRRFTSDYGKH